MRGAARSCSSSCGAGTPACTDSTWYRRWSRRPGGRDPSGAIDYRVQDATRLEYPDATFDTALYLAGVLCFLEEAPLRDRALAEARRILRPGGVAIFGLNCLDGRERSAGFRTYSRYLALLRRARGSSRSAQLLPWLRRRGWPNPRALLDRGPHVYWFRIAEAAERLEAAGFRIVAAGSAAEVARGELADDPHRLRVEEAGTVVHFVCTAGAAVPRQLDAAGRRSPPSRSRARLP